MDPKVPIHQRKGWRLHRLMMDAQSHTCLKTPRNMILKAGPILFQFSPSPSSASNFECTGLLGIASPALPQECQATLDVSLLLKRCRPGRVCK
jgi:hypothetical protein